MDNKITNELFLPKTFEDSLVENAIDAVSELAEVGLDAIMNDGLLREVPFLSTIISVYKIGTNIHARYSLKKLVVFLNEINTHFVDGVKKQNYISKLREEPKIRQKELEYLLVIIDRYIGLNKPKMLARLYFAFLDESLSWDELCMYSEVIDRFLVNDYHILSIGDAILSDYNGNEAILRLEALGLMAERREVDHIISGGILGEPFDEKTLEERRYFRTEFGEKLVRIISDNQYITG